MSKPPQADTDELIARLADGDETCVQELLGRHRDRLRKMVAVRMDPRLSARVDASDVVQEALMEASQKLSDYARKKPLAYYPWLRQIAWERLAHLHTRHLAAERRAVDREAAVRMELSDQSVMQLAERFAASATAPSANLLRQELRQRVRDALELLADADREILVLRYLEQLKVKEVASVMGISEGAGSMNSSACCASTATVSNSSA